MITEEVVKAIEASVLCWLATVAPNGSPNVSPKEAFMYDGEGKIIVAYIASPQTMRNIENEPRVCLSFIDVFTQKGFKVRGIATILRTSHERYQTQKVKLTALVGDTFQIPAVIEVEPTKIEEIIAPSYRLFPDISRGSMIQQSLVTYKVNDYQNESRESHHSHSETA